MVEILISLSPSDRDIRGIFYLRSLGKVIRPVSASVLQTVKRTLHSLTLLFYLARFSLLVKSPFGDSHLGVVPPEHLTIIGYWREPVKPCTRRFCLKPCLDIDAPKTLCPLNTFHDPGLFSFSEPHI